MNSPSGEIVGCPSRPMLLDFSMGREQSVAFEAIAEHVAYCQTCSDELDRLEQESDPFLRDLRRLLQNARDAPTQCPAETYSSTDLAQGLNRSYGQLAKLGPFELVEEIGRGGMGVVYRALQPGLNRMVAIKTLVCVPLAVPTALRRFQTEAEAIGRLQHPNIVQVHEYGEHDGRPYLCMEFVEGLSLAKLLATGPLPEETAVEMLMSIAAAVQYAHEHHVLHRDLKPANVLVGAKEVKLTDFGLARLTDINDGQTRAYTALGTANYMAPEQVTCQPSQLSVRTDVYGLGGILYEMLTGQPPFQGETTEDTLTKVQHEQLVRPSRLRPGIARNLEAICIKCLSKDAELRYATAQDLIDDLHRLRRGDPVRAATDVWLRVSKRTSRRMTIGLLLAAAFFAAGFWAYLGSTEFRRHANRARFLRGETVTLVAETGPPGWQNIAIGRDHAAISLSPSGNFTVHTWDFCFVELFENPIADRYTFEAEVRHQKSDLAGEVGLFVGHHQIENGKAREFVQFSYNDIRGKEEITKRISPLFEKKLPRLFNYPIMCPRVLVQLTDGQWSGGRILPVSGPSFEPIGVAGGPWRKLKVSVSPTLLEADWEGKRLPSLEIAKIEGRLRIVECTLQQTTPRPTPKQLRTGSLGLYVYRGTASFRNVVLSPY